MSKVTGLGLSYDDVLLTPRASRVVPRDVSVRTTFAGDIELAIPVVSAAMDTVTETAAAIALARSGGIGVIHKRQTVEAQTDMVRRVKRSESGMISDPITLHPEASLQDAEDLMAHYRISGVPIIDGDSKLVGIITNRDIRFEDDYTRAVSTRMTSENLITANTGVDLKYAREILRTERIEKLPIVDPDGTLTGLITIKDLRKTTDYPLATKDGSGRLCTAAAVGASKDLADRAAGLVEAGVDALILDSAHGHSEGILDALETLRETYPDLPLVAGNVATQTGAEDLIKRGADAIKVGIGPGSICTTRIVTGVGVPQFTAVLDAASVALDHDVAVIADGGVKQTGDFAKAIGAGATSVMLGSLLAGTDEAPGEDLLHEGRRYKSYRGMGSLGAMGGDSSSAERYFQSGAEKLVPEGVEGMVPHRGPMADVIHQLIGGLRAAMGYCGAPDLDTFRTESTFTQITASGIRESHPHDIRITRETPNYTLSD
ncbi:MAG: IMP dehydrogenase [Acidimicrobiia bacterium]|nr:IMP dehydrogenase [Acidimicrobiia bacterium]